LVAFIFEIRLSSSVRHCSLTFHTVSKKIYPQRKAIAANTTRRTVSTPLATRHTPLQLARRAGFDCGGRSYCLDAQIQYRSRGSATFVLYP
jgi:hypothetical protein